MVKEEEPGGFTPRSYRPSIRKSLYWKERIKKNLQTLHVEGLLRHGRVDPHRKFTEQELREFYSNRLPHPDRVIDNQTFARWAIEEALREYSPDTRFQLTGGIMQGQTIKMSKVERKTLGEITKTVQAESQLEVDAENPNGSKETDNEFTQDVGTIAQCIISASPNCLGPPIEASAMYLQMEKCGEYGPNKLSRWRSSLFPRLDGQDGRKAFHDNQITAIVWILSRFLGELPRLRIKHKDLWDEGTKKYIQIPETKTERENRRKLRGPKYFGGILADSMGLGKTLTTIAVLDILATQRLNLVIEGGKERHRPMLILTPNTIVATQWMDEINLIGSGRGIKQIIISGHGFQKRDNQLRIESLTRKEFDTDWPQKLRYVWDEDDPKASKTVIIMSIDAFAGRTCVATKDDKGKQKWTSTFKDMNRRFSVVVVDEAYKVRNTATKNWKSVALLDRQFTLLITATPCQNHIKDLLGPIQMFWDNPYEYLRRKELLQHLQAVFVIPLDLQRLDAMSLDDDRRLVAGSPALLAKLIYRFRGSATVDIQETRMFLKYFESLAILRRAPSSRLNVDWEGTKQVSLEGLLPTVDNYTVNIQCDEALEREYQREHIDLLIEYMKTLDDWKQNPKKNPKQNRKNPDLKPIFSLYRLFSLAAASLDVYRLEKLFTLNGFGTKSTDVRTMRKSNINFMHLAPFLLNPSDPKPKIALDYVKLAVRKSPILRYILYYVKGNLFGRGKKGKIKKLLITEGNPMLAYYYELVLQFLLIHCRTLHSGLTAEERRELIADFNSDTDHSCQVLIQMYTVSFAGSNLHKNCSRVLVASQAYSLAVQTQAVHRVIRVGQESGVKVYRLKVNNSFHSFQESRQVEKILPELGTRAQGPLNDVLVQVLNLFQSEIDDLWKNPDVQDLVENMDLITSPTVEREEPGSKRIKLEDGSAIQVESSEDAMGINVSPRIKPIPRSTPLRLATDSNGKRKGHDMSTTSLFKTEPESFLELKPRSAYYNEFKALPRELKSYFCHKKNTLRRMLSYSSRNNNAVTRVWNVKDLDDSAVLERAMELILRIRLGTNSIEMLPLPQIDFSLAPQQKLKMLAGLLSEVEVTAQDIQEKQDREDSKGLKKEKGPAEWRKDMPMSELERIMRDNALGSKYSKSSRNSSMAASSMNGNSESEGEEEDDDEDEEGEKYCTPDEFRQNSYPEADDDEKDKLWKRLNAASGDKKTKAEITADPDDLTFLSSRPVRKDRSSSHNLVDLTGDEPTGTGRTKRESSAESMFDSDSDSDEAHRLRIKWEDLIISSDVLKDDYVD
ncbi:P-loop containing nucleoside triphosphate hydrolase protein [Daldinia bambusicola]|nr:P-loop containing nucleoside triphosphate hydrolase protein [Daldinia bambusicola]